MPGSAASDATTQVHRLFFAIRPDAAVAAAACDLARRACSRHGLTGRPQDAERLHVTLHWLGDHAEPPTELIRAALRAGERTDTAPFEVAFDRLQSLGSAGQHRRPVVLSGRAGLVALRRFQRTLAGSMADAGIGRHVRDARTFHPHVTLLYDDKGVRARAIAPIRWTVHEFLLIESLVGQSRYSVLGRWSLALRQAGFTGW